MTGEPRRSASGADPTSGRRWLIDGNNVMGSRPDGWWRDRPAAKRRLARQVARWAAPVPRSVVLFFDGHPDAAVVAATEDRIEVRFGGRGRPDAADDRIVAAAVPGDRVVTADRGLIDRLPAGVEVVGPTRLLDSLGTPATGEPSE